jgi:peptidyl-prolyl cis-trans isomerase D
MFNMFRSQQKVTKYLLGGLLVVVAASMVTYLIPNTGFATDTSGVSGVVAEIGDQKITADEAKARMDQLVTAGQLPADSAETYLPQLVDQMVQDRAAIYAFGKLGLTVSDEEVLGALMAIYPQFFQNGKLVATDQLEQALMNQQGMTLAQGVDAMRSQLLLRKVQNMAVMSVVVTPQEVDDALIRKHETAKIEYVAFPPAKFRDQVKPTPEELMKDFQANRARYTVPEKQSFQVLVVDQKKMEQSMTVTDAQLHQAYAASMDNFRTPERVKVRHILLMTQGKSDAEKKTILAKAQGLLKQIRSGADFAELAKKNSQDPGSAQNGGDLGYIVRGQTVPEFEKFVFSAKPNEISDIVTTEYGYHIIQVLEKEPARVKPFDEVKDSLADQLKKQEVNDKMQSAADQARAALAKAPGSAAEVAKQFGLDLITVNKAAVGEPIQGLGPAPEISNALAGMKPNDVSDSLVLASGDKMAIVVMTGKIPARPADYADVQEKVRENYITTQSTLLANAAAKKAGDEAHAGEDLDKVAKAFKVDLVKSADFTMNDSVEGLGPAALVSDAFSKPVGTVIGPVTVSGRNIVFKVIGRQTVDPKNYSNERDSALQELKQQKARDMYNLFEDSILNQIRADGKLKIHQDTIQQLAATYRTTR